MNTDILILKDMPLGLKVKVARTARKLRQMDVAYLATAELARRDLAHFRITPSDVGWLERGWRITSWKRDAILAVLGLEVGA